MRSERPALPWCINTGKSLIPLTLRFFAQKRNLLIPLGLSGVMHQGIEELEAEGLPLDVIALELGKDLDPFDLICHVAFDAKPLTRRERADNVKKRNVFNKYGDQARAVLDALLAKYADEGVFNLDDITVLRIPPFTQLGTPVQLIEVFGGREGFVEAVHELQSSLYRETA